MPTKVTENIEISVITKFELEQSSITDKQYLFSYTIDIKNLRDSPVQLLSRHWFIFDSIGKYNEVKGEGVIGQQPIINQGQIHSYQSFCRLQSDIGLMWGTFLMKSLEDDKLFEVKIPEFQLITPERLN
jgi:ApaG protein